MAGYRGNLPARRGRERELFPFEDATLFSPTSHIGSPWGAMRRMQEDLDRLLEQVSAAQMLQGGASALAQAWSPSVDVCEDEREWTVDVDLPGVSPDDIEVHIQDRNLILSAQLKEEIGPDEADDQSGEANGRRYHRRERRFGYFERMIPLPENADEENIRADFRNGVLTLHLPKQQDAAPRSRRISIGGGESREGVGGEGKQQQPNAASAKGGESGAEGGKEGKTGDASAPKAAQAQSGDSKAEGKVADESADRKAEAKSGDASAENRQDAKGGRNGQGEGSGGDGQKADAGAESGKREKKKQKA